jgi:hypothetical protein
MVLLKVIVAMRYVVNMHALVLNIRRCAAIGT